MAYSWILFFSYQDARSNTHQISIRMLFWSVCKGLALSYLEAPYVDTCGGTEENRLYVTVRVDGPQNL